MSLYHESAAFLAPSTPSTPQPSLKSGVFAAESLCSKPTHIYALVIETTKWSTVLSPIIERTGLLDEERKLTPALALLLVHDLLVSKKGVAAPRDHVLRRCVERHRARLSSEFARARVKAGCGTLEEWREKIEGWLVEDEDGGRDGRCKHPRWVRVNALRTTPEDECESGVFAGWKKVDSLRKVMDARANGAEGRVFALDEHVPDLLATPPGTDLTATAAYRQGRVFLQDKASCFPALLLDPARALGRGDILDACAAPGNKTTHLAALLSKSECSRSRTIFAVERDAERARTLEKMVGTAGASAWVQILAKQDFLRLKPGDERFRDVTAILLDPSCSGSGIVGRDDGEEDLTARLVLPRRGAEDAVVTEGSRSRKRKRIAPSGPAKESIQERNPRAETLLKISHNASDEMEDARAISTNHHVSIQERLKGLSDFQTRMLQHAMTFPHCSHIVYSTCSVHGEENEQVVLRALKIGAGKEQGEWKPLIRDDQPEGLRKWSKRGFAKALEDTADDQAPEGLAEACIRCEKGGEAGTTGFFVCGLERKLVAQNGRMSLSMSPANAPQGERNVAESESESEWEGFED